MSKTEVVVSLAWYVILALVIYFVNINAISWICLFAGAMFMTTSFMRSTKSKGIMQLILLVLLFVVYFIRPY